MAFALDEEPDFPTALAADLQARRDLLCAGLADVGLDVRAPEGTYFATTDISALGWEDGLSFCRALPERAGVVAIPTQGFYDSDAGRQLVRWAFCKQPDVIEEGLRRLAGADLFQLAADDPVGDPRRVTLPARSLAVAVAVTWLPRLRTVVTLQDATPVSLSVALQRTFGALPR